MAKRMMTVAAAVLVAAALGVGGVLVASRSGQREPAVLTGLQVSDDQSALSAGGAANPQTAPGQSRGSVAPPASQRVLPGPLRYEVRGKLPELPDSARAWTLDESASAASVSELAGKLGLTGQPKQEELSWTVTEGTMRLRVSKVPGMPWSFGTTRLVCGGPMPGGVSPKGRGMACATVEPELSKAPPAAAPVQLPDRATAERIARDLLGRVGVQPDAAELQLTRGFDRWLALASPRVGGMPTAGFSWSVGIGSKGQVVSAGGWLSTPKQGDTYPLITVQQALDRLRQRQRPGPVTGIPQPLPSPVRPECIRGDESKGCATPQVPNTVTVTDVRLGLQLASVLQGSGGGQRVDYLVPAYFFQLQGTWAQQVTVIAVQDRFLTAPTPTAVPLRTR